MKRITLLLAGLMLIAGNSVAETDYIAMEWINNIIKGLDVHKQIDDLRTKDDAVIGDDLTVVDDAAVGGDAAVTGDTSVGGDLTVTGDADVSGSMQVSGLYRDVPTALSVTNGQAVTVAEQSYIVSGIGSANDNTNTVTLADPGTALLGHRVKFITASTATNLFGLADTGNLKLTAVWAGDTYDSIELYASETNAWVELGRNDN